MLRVLDLSHSRISSLQLYSLGQQSVLQHLVLESCWWLTALPDSLGQLPALESLDLRGCVGLTVLPDSLRQLSVLKRLGLSSCHMLTRLPDSLGHPDGTGAVVSGTLPQPDHFAG